MDIYGYAGGDKPHKQRVARTKKRARIRVIGENIRLHAVGDIFAHEVYDGRIVAMVKHVSSLPRIVLQCTGAKRTMGSGIK